MKSQWHTGLLCRFECRDVVGLAILPENASWRDWQVGAPRSHALSLGLAMRIKHEPSGRPLSGQRPTAT
jgi:hypothetical protein